MLPCRSSRRCPRRGEKIGGYDRPSLVLMGCAAEDLGGGGAENGSNSRKPEHQLAGLLRKDVPCSTPSRQSGLRGRGQTPSTAAPLATRPSPVASLTMTLATASGFSAPRSVLAASPVSFPIAVFTRPGQTAQTLIPVAESSCASASVKPIIPNLLAQ